MKPLHCETELALSDIVVQTVVMVTSCGQLLPHQQLQPGCIVELVSPETASACSTF